LTAAGGAGPRARRRSAFLIAALALLLSAGCASASKKAAPSYGSLPSFLPKASFQPDGVLNASAARPALAAEGDGVRVQLPTGSVLMTVTGPEVPGEGLPYQTDATTCTWTITMSAASTSVPIVVGDFSTIDHLGQVYRPGLVPGQPVPPATVAPGQTLTFELRTVMAVGEGLMRWAPGRSKILASWDFEVETD
jgi:hypothetical protein